MRRQAIRRFLDIADLSDLNRLVILIVCQSDVVSGLGHGLAVPELVWLEQRNDVFEQGNAFVLLVLLHLHLDQIGSLGERAIFNRFSEEHLLLRFKLQLRCVLLEQLFVLFDFRCGNGNV